MKEFNIAVFKGDGIGEEITDPCISLLDKAANKTGGFRLNYQFLHAGARTYQQTGMALPEDALQQAKDSDAILLAAMGLPEIRYPDGTEIAPQIELREKLKLYAGVRPVRAVPGSVIPLADPRAQKLNFVLVRESTEGLFAARRLHSLENDSIAHDTMEITREVSERLFHFSFQLAVKRKTKGLPGHVTLIDKANVLPSMAFFRRVFDEIAEQYPHIESERAYVDATALNMVRRPWIFDVLVTENMFGDILSDLGAGLIGGMGMAPSADIGDQHAVFQPCHGSAPDIAGSGKANPTAMFLSGAMMLEWLGDIFDIQNCRRASELIITAVDQAFEKGQLRTCEVGGSHGTQEITNHVFNTLDTIE